jgi:predicted Zn-dependent protease
VNRLERFISALIAGFLVALLCGEGLLPGLMAGVAAVPSPSVVGQKQETSPDSLEVEPVAKPDNTLPTPYPEAPDGTLRLPPVGSAESPQGEDALSVPEAAAAEAGPVYTTAELLADLPPDVAKRSALLIEADQLFAAGDTATAEIIYRRAKDSKWLAEMAPDLRIAPITDPAALPPAGAVYWREAQAGANSGVASRVLVPLELLVTEYPEFLPGQALYARYLVEHDQADKALDILEEAVSRYPFYPDLLKAQAEVQMAQEKWVEAAITAKQFVVLNPNHPEAPEMDQLAQENLDRFRGEMNQTLTRNLVSNIITGAAGYLLTGGLFGPFTALNSGILLMQGESNLGAQVADQVARQVPMADDPEIRGYVDHIGQKLAALTGRDEFDYRFEVVMDDSLNAFALPGGKIFINAGAIEKTYSEAELAGLIGHEISHAVLSHGFQMVTQGNLTSSLASFIPIPEVANIAAGLIVSSYSRDMERQADVLGTQILATGQYAADGLHNLMVTLKEEYGEGGISWFASHPAPDERVGYLKQLVDQGGFSRYAYEGVEPHLKIRKKMTQLMTQFKLENGIQTDS